jgi:NMD protein affecting ribosome stability and mRNA decay
MADDFEYDNGADGSCQQCGGPTEAEWHAFCPDCFAEQQGWRRGRDRVALEGQHEQRQRTSMLRLVERVDELERAVVLAAELLAALTRRLEQLERPRADERRAA